MSANATLVPVAQQDYLEQDPAIRGQKYACMSVINPADVIKRKDVWIFQEFLTSISAEMNDLWTNTIEQNKDSQPEFVDSLRKIMDRYDYAFDSSKLHEAYDFYKSSQQERLESEYLEKNNFQTSIAGIKIRGCYDTLREANIRAEVLKRKDPHFNVYIGEVGCWLPLDPDPSQIDNQEFAETQLNTLIKGYMENQAQKDAYYESRKDILMEQAEETNEIRKKKIQEEISLETRLQEQDPWMANREEKIADNDENERNVAVIPDEGADMVADDTTSAVATSTATTSTTAAKWRSSDGRVTVEWRSSDGRVTAENDRI